MESRVIVKLIARVRWGLSVTRHPLYSARVSAASAPPHLIHVPTDPAFCPSQITASRKFHTDTFEKSLHFDLCEVSTKK